MPKNSKYAIQSKRTKPESSIILHLSDSYNMKSDPSLQKGYVQLVQCEIQMIIRSETSSFEDAVMVRVFKNQTNYKVEMTSETNMSFLYLMLATPKELQGIIGEEIKEEIAWFRDIFSGAHSYELTLNTADSAQLTVWQREKFKNYELAVLPFEIGSEEAIHESIMYRYERMRLRERMLDNYWQSVCGIVRTKNPSLLLQLEHRLKKQVFR